MLPAAGLAFRPAGPEDVAAVVDLVESAYRGDASRAGWTTEADLLGGQRTDGSEMTGLIAADDSLVLVAEMDGRADRGRMGLHGAPDDGDPPAGK